MDHATVRPDHGSGPVTAPALPEPAEDFQAVARRLQTVNDRLVADLAVLTGLTPATVRVRYFEDEQ